MFLQSSGVSADSRGMKASLRLVLIALVAMLLLSAPAAAAKKKPCKDAGLVPTAATQIARVQSATRCLVNRERTKRGLKRLKANADLLKSADFQAHDMLDNQYFDHTRSGGPDFVERILRFGYAADARGYTIGENIAWASSPIATPRKMVSLWMHSPPHRKNILTKGYRDQAVSALWSAGGIGGAYAESGGPFLIFVNQFGAQYE
jgi:uncharacterized protein YkwD